MKANQVLARLDPDEQKTDVQAAQASVDAAEAMLRQSTLAFERQNLLTTGNTTRRDHDKEPTASS